jgi:hypothetical protein
LGLGALVLAGGCVSQPSLQPLFTDDEAVAVPEALGSWIAEKNGDDPDDVRIELRTGKDGDVTMLLRAEGRPASFKVRFGRLGGDLFWDTLPGPTEDESAFYAAHRLPAHGFARVRVEEDRLEVAVLDSDWIKDLQRRGRLDLAHEIVDGDVLLTAPTEELQRFLSAHAGDPEAFEEPTVFHRPAPGPAKLPAPAAGW